MIPVSQQYAAAVAVEGNDCEFKILQWNQQHGEVRVEL
jgi:hypothetical protein